MSDNDDDKKAKKFNPPHSGAVPQAERAEHFAAMTPPAPAASPGVPLGADSDTPTGEHPVTKNELKHWGTVNDLKQFVAMICVAIAAVFAAYKFVLADAAAQTDAKQAVLEQKMAVRFAQTDAAIVGVQEDVKRNEAQTAEMRVDLREFYKSWRDDRPSPRLEQPLTLPVRHTPDAGR